MISRSLEHFFLTIGQNNFVNKIPFGALLYANGQKYMTAVFFSSAEMEMLLKKENFLPYLLNQ